MEKINIFEAFAGIGSQNRALSNIGLDYKIIGTSEIDVDAIISYASIHNGLNEYNEHFFNDYNFVDIKDKKEYIERLGLIKNNKKLNINSLSVYEINKIYAACKLNNNFGDITNVNPKEIPKIDLLTYSFPCQDISTVGTGLGFDKGTGTRSSLLWETKRIIDTKQPKYLVLENVASIVNKNHIESFNRWIEYLNNLGYTSKWSILDSQNFGIPQRRKRVFLVSTLNSNIFDFSNLRKKKKKSISKYLDETLEYQDIYYYDETIKQINGKIIKPFSFKEGQLKFWDDRDWRRNGIMIQDVCSTQRAGRTGLKCVRMEKNKLKVRRLTAEESLLLMGFEKEDYVNMKAVGISDTNIFKQAGNSIVVDVLESIFEVLFKKEVLLT